MKKILTSLLIFLMIIGYGVYYFKTVVLSNTIYLNAADEQSYLLLQKLQHALKDEGKHVVLSKANDHKSGKFNLYTAVNINSLPKVLDDKAINVLWIDYVPNGENAEPLRPFDVVIVKNLPGFGHLKAINVRSAFIPDAINVSELSKTVPTEKVMYWGDNTKFSPALYLASVEKFSLDIYGKGFDGAWPQKDLKGELPDYSIFKQYHIVLVDQTDDEISQEKLSPKIIQIIENGGLPLVLYNPAIEQIFGNTVPMYETAQNFMPAVKHLLNTPHEIQKRKEDIFEMSKKWNSSSQAKKIIEIFDIMNQKMIQ